MSGDLAPLPIWQFVDNNGHPLSGGSIQFYQSGTQNPVPIYADIEMQILLRNPLPLDSAGRPTAASGPTTVWLDPSIAYKLLLKDANGVLVWSADPIVSPGVGQPGPPGPPGPQGPPGQIVGQVVYTSGTFQPVLMALEGNTGQAYSRQVGAYVRIGDIVWVSGEIWLSTRGSFVSTIGIGGLPFPVVHSDHQFPDAGTITIATWSGLARPTSFMSGFAISDPSMFWLRGTQGFGLTYETYPLYEEDFADESRIAFGGFYIAQGG